MLTTFGVKIVLLQGSSGSGKSSFLRAGLIPHLKKNSSHDPRHCYFLFRSEDGVIRCTADPLAEIARSIMAALRCNRPLVSGAGVDSELHEQLREPAIEAIETAFLGSRSNLSEVLIELLTRLCSELSGRLLLVLDQAEEVLTQAAAGSNEEASSAFFRFLEDVYVQNIDLRIVISLRTEYYGRLRDELRISDDRLGNRPRSGGVEPYLLRPVRNLQSLRRIIVAPASVITEAGPSIYNFSFEESLPEMIVSDLLAEFPHASVMPALQVVCLSLYAALDSNGRVVTIASYNKMGKVAGIIRDYVRRGLNDVEPAGRAEIDQWYLLLFSLVSRQGGGTVVSLSESSEELQKRAERLGIRRPIKEALNKLTGGIAPLLRGEPSKAPTYYSLKHDVLAVILSRWNDEHGGALRARKETQVRFRWLFGGAVLTTIVVVAFTAFIAYDRGQASFAAKRTSIELKNTYAIRAPTSDFRLSLLLALANIDAARRPNSVREVFFGEQPPDFYERAFGDNTMYEKSLITLRQVIAKAPWLGGRYDAASLDPTDSRFVTLKLDDSGAFIVNLYTLPNESDPQTSAAIETRRIPKSHTVAANSDAASTAPAVGFVKGLGSVAFAAGKLFFWNNEGELQERDLLGALPSSFRTMAPPRVDFIAGRLQLTQWGSGPRSSSHTFYLDKPDILVDPPRFGENESKVSRQREPTQPAPVYSESVEHAQQYGMLQVIPEAVKSSDVKLPIEKQVGDLVAPSRLAELDIILGRVDETRVERYPVARVLPPPPGILERRRSTMAFAAGADAVIFKMDGPGFDVFEFGPVVTSDDGQRQRALIRRSIEVTSKNSQEDWSVRPASMPFIQPLIAGVKSASGWRAAWSGVNGVWVVETTSRDGTSAAAMFDGP